VSNREGPPWSVTTAPRRFWWGIFFAVWTIQVGLYAFATYYRRRGTVDPMSVSEALFVAAIDWYLWAAICLLCFWIARKLPLEKHGVRFLAIALASISAGITLARGVLDQGIAALLGWAPMTLLDRVIPTLPGRWIFILLFFGVGYAIEYIRLHREREVKAANLRAELANAQLQMLKVQLQPHFLFNTLNAISSLMYIDVEAADRMLVRLSELLRRTLQTMEAQQVTLAEEISFIEPYLEIERIRLSHRLTVEMRIAPGTNSALVPHLILQPLVENAIRHGIFPKLQGGTLVIASEARENDLVLTVEDDGVGLGDESPNGCAGVGLANTRERLRHLYGDAFRFTIENREERGVRVRIRLPLEFSSTSPAGSAARALIAAEQVQ
jgi:two-component system, LytTR family, sensor kinase